MSEKNRQKILASEGKYRGLGAWTEKDGITFSAAAPSKEPVSLILYRKGTEEIAEEIPFPDSGYSGVVRTLKAAIAPDKYEYNFRIGQKVVVDPAARLVTGSPVFGDRAHRGEHQRRAGFVKKGFDWKEDQKALRIPYEDGILYHLHVRGFTKQKNSRVRHKGTFLGLQEKLPYLKELGVNQVLLMPAYEFDEIMREPGCGTSLMEVENQKGGRINYWGYVPGFYFAPKQSYCATKQPDVEFKTMVRTFHENGIEVLMEFAFPDPLNMNMVSDCLTWWVQEYHVDGFSLLMNQEAANQLAGNPVLRKTKLLSGYFPSDRIYPSGRGHDFRNLAECNEGFKITARKLLKGDENQLSGFVDRVRYNPKDSGVVNYITGHDGFTLMDLVSYDKKHNESNGEQGRDGAACEYSWNCGAEGPTKKRMINRLRLRQMKNAFAMLLLSQGTPMLLAGDEFGNSQQGNNNPYCHDSELTWVDWSKEKSGRELTDFVKKLIAFRREHRILHMERPLLGADTLSCGYPDFSCHGSRAWYGAFEYQNRHVGLMYCGMYAGTREFVYAAYNFHWDPQTLALPNLPEGMAWSLRLDTADTKGDPETEGNGLKLIQGREMEVPGRSVRVLVSESLPEMKKTKPSDEQKKTETEIISE
ncbi:MAG: hypothetical protein Q4E91_04100 [Lachnospiraceae bacterium]|nr:hypothetical protein [Lachnospiraceae bacterium]